MLFRLFTSRREMYQHLPSPRVPRTTCESLQKFHGTEDARWPRSGRAADCLMAFLSFLIIASVTDVVSRGTLYSLPVFFRFLGHSYHHRSP